VSSSSRDLSPSADIALEKMARAIFVDDFGGRADALWESVVEVERAAYCILATPARP
jgi:hypothetical protein